ncbi:24483_t:CDS:2, partial [Dentiscutata erythropus]
MSGKKNTSNVSSKKTKNSNSTSIEADKAEEPVINQAKAVFGRMLRGSSSKANKTPPGNEGSKSTKTLLVAQRPKLTKAVEISDDDEQNELSSPLVQPPTKGQKALSSANEEEESDDEEMSHASRLPQDSGNTCDSSSMSLVRQESTRAELTAHDFNYAVNFLDQKINSLKAYKEVTKQLIPATLYPSPKEYRVALERYLEEHADHFINTIGRSAWISYFNEKLLHELKNKCRNKRNDIASTIRNATFTVLNIGRVDNNISATKLSEWKASKETCNAYNSLFENDELITSICLLAFKQFRGNSLPPIHCAYTMAILDILLNPTSSSIRCTNKAIARRVHVLMEAYEKEQSVSQEQLAEIACVEEAIETAKRTKKKSKADSAEE